MFLSGLCQVKKKVIKMCGLIDLNNTVENEDETAPLQSCGQSSASDPEKQQTTSLSSSSPSSVCMVLWHACAGPLISLPKKGSGVVYFPQGHVEHLPEHPSVVYDLPPHVFCRVVDVKLHADAANDEVYAQVSLVLDELIERKWREGRLESENGDDDSECVQKSITPHMFCKTLTASDTSTHGGFSVPRRAAEDCFPPLDYKQQRPSQELVAKDLHGIEWKFRHIYRGQPRRHLLTTGWSAFVNKKKLVSGDAVLFLRGGDGELRLGIRRASQVKSGATILPPNGQQFNASSLASIVNSISLRDAFSICYNPRGRSSEIIAPYHKFSKSLAQSYSPGTRFRTRFETEDSSERRCSGIIIGVSDVDPVRWPGSKWKCLVARWDDMVLNRLNRVSPWEIEPNGSVPGPNGFMLPGTKRIRIGIPTLKPDVNVPRSVSDLTKPSLRFHKVLQGQEIFGFRTPFREVEASRHHRHQQTPLGESFQYRKVLQGQEIVHQKTIPCGLIPESNYRKNVQTIALPSSPSTTLLLQQPCSQPSLFSSLILGYQNTPNTTSPIMSAATYVNSTVKDVLHGSIRSTGETRENNQSGFVHHPLLTQPLCKDHQNYASLNKTSCRLFGFPLAEGKLVTAEEEHAASSYRHKSSCISLPNEGQVLQVTPVRDRLVDVPL